MNLQLINLIITSSIMAILIILNSLHIGITRKGLKKINGVLKDIILEIKKPGRDPREEDGMKPILRTDVLKIEDIKEGMVLKGTVRNVVDFGAFVDIGIKNDGLVHKSQMSNKFVKDPMEIVSVGDVIDVKVIGIDLDKGRVSLSMKL